MYVYVYIYICVCVCWLWTASWTGLRRVEPTINSAPEFRSRAASQDSKGRLEKNMCVCMLIEINSMCSTTTTTAAVHHTTSSSCGWGDHWNHCNQSQNHNSNHLSVNQWIRSAIRESQQPTSPIGFLFWNFRHRLVRYYWYMYVCIYIYICIQYVAGFYGVW